FTEDVVQLAIHLGKRARPLSKQLVGDGRFGRSPLQDDLLRVRNDHVERGAVLGADRRRGVIEEVELQVRAQEVGILRRDDERQIEGLDFLQRLKDGLVGSEYERVLAVLRVLAELVGQQKLVEYARGHEDRLTQAHGQ